MFKGSEAKLNTTPSCHKYLIDLRIFLQEKGVIVQSNNCYQFVEDYVFSSPSTAGGVILGRATNGWTKWKNSEGKTLVENPLKVVPLIHSNLTPVKFSHSPFCLFLFSSYSSCPLCRVLH